MFKKCLRNVKSNIRDLLQRRRSRIDRQEGFGAMKFESAMLKE